MRTGLSKRSPQTALPTWFTKPLAHTFASGATRSTLAAAPLCLMVRTYIRKGGHGGDSSKAGLPAGYWQEKSGRAAAAAAKAKELLEEEAAKAAATNRWKQWAK